MFRPKNGQLNRWHDQLFCDLQDFNSKKKRFYKHRVYIKQNLEKEFDNKNPPQKIKQKRISTKKDFSKKKN